MSVADDKNTVKQANEFFKKVQTESETIFKKSGFDRQLSEKIKRVGEGASEVVKHIEQRTGPKNNS